VGGPADSEEAARAAYLQESAGGPDAYVIGIVTDTRHSWNRERSLSSRQTPVLMSKIISLSANAGADEQTHLLMRKRVCL